MADVEKMIKKLDNLMESKTEEEKVEYFESFGFERDTSCPSSIAPVEEEVKDENCKKCLIRSDCHYYNSDEPKSKRTILCNQTMDSHLKMYRAKVELERKSRELLHKEATEELDRAYVENNVHNSLPNVIRPQSGDVEIISEEEIGHPRTRKDNLPKEGGIRTYI